jgi:hypothetical protein
MDARLLNLSPSSCKNPSLSLIYSGGCKGSRMIASSGCHLKSSQENEILPLLEKNLLLLKLLKEVFENLKKAMQSLPRKKK